ncbi:hypothetical protein CLV78_102237 [Aliiruegeria haliotis]|uniref:DUF465 domain-containing protein n=1 Tax=Aliiruegeria haliotis TaxID=1280846 RepID=A0A2T0RV84_9RHOB|nr:YdcH family protein [Aliiruegeria haliotis]PRY25060.1 hypothetical protein CLV78_102237 [Aliiruegeria haliotis]
MSHVPHELAEEFPEQQELIPALIDRDPVFAALVKEYSALNIRVHQSEVHERPMEELAEHQLRKRRMFLKDEIYRRLRTAA